MSLSFSFLVNKSQSNTFFNILEISPLNIIFNLLSVSFTFFLMDFFLSSWKSFSLPSNNLTIAVLLNIFFLPENIVFIFFFEFSEFTSSKIGNKTTSQTSSYFFLFTRDKNKDPYPSAS